MWLGDPLKREKKCLSGDFPVRPGVQARRDNDVDLGGEEAAHEPKSTTQDLDFSSKWWLCAMANHRYRSSYPNVLRSRSPRTRDRTGSDES
jgi:hypothetical protein